MPAAAGVPAAGSNSSSNSICHRDLGRGLLETTVNNWSNSASDHLFFLGWNFSCKKAILIIMAITLSQSVSLCKKVLMLSQWQVFCVVSIGPRLGHKSHMEVSIGGQV